MPLAVYLHYTFSVHKLPGFLLKLVSQHSEALGCALRFWRACTAVFWWAVASCNCRRIPRGSSKSNARGMPGPSRTIGQQASEWFIWATFVHLCDWLLCFINASVIRSKINVFSPRVCVQWNYDLLLQPSINSLSAQRSRVSFLPFLPQHNLAPRKRTCFDVALCGGSKCLPLPLWYILSLLELQFWHVQTWSMKGFLKCCLLCISKESVRICSVVIAGGFLKVKKAIWDFEKWGHLLRYLAHLNLKDSWTHWHLSLCQTIKAVGPGLHVCRVARKQAWRLF